MRIRTIGTMAIIGAAVLFRPFDAEACSCGGTIPTSIALRWADAVFLGTVSRVERPQPISHVNTDGSVTVEINAQPTSTIFDPSRVFRGPAVPQVAVVGHNSSCDKSFEPGEVWLVYGHDAVGGIEIDPCSRTRLGSETAQDLAYLEGIESGRQQGIVYGDVLRRKSSPAGKTGLYVLLEPVHVVAAMGSRRFVATSERWGPYQLVLPAGDFDIWVERNDTPVSTNVSVHVEHGADLRLQLVVEYPDNDR